MEKMRSSSLKLLCLVFVNLIALSIAKRNVRSIDWVVQETSYTRLCSTKKILTVNGRFPGPALHLYNGDRLRVNVHNQASNDVAIHWHGDWKYVKPNPVKPGGNFTYDIKLLDEEGTLWWHADNDWSRATAHGPIFVYPKPARKYPYSLQPDAQIPIVVGTWYKGDLMQMMEEALASGRETKRLDALTINGQPGDTQSCSIKDMFKTTIEHGKTYLLRIINAAMDEELLFVVANHELVVVAVNAAYVEPFSTNSVTIAPSQTMDVLLVANQPRSHYYMVARAFGGIMATAIVQYEGDYVPPVNATFPTLSNSNHGGVERYSKFSLVDYNAVVS